MKFRELYVAEVFIRSWLRHPTMISAMWTLPQIVKIQNGTKSTQHASLRREA